MSSEYILTQIYGNFPFEPTFGQKKIIENFSEYLADDDPTRIFILNGYAGTGKTSIIAAVVGALKAIGVPSVLLAPTGRAAKVSAHYCNHRAYTIHKKIYRQRSGASFEAEFSLDINKERGAVFIVDEASMLSNGAGDSVVFGSGDLLSDLVKYVRSGKDCRLILVGDNAQLPPIGLDRSPALDADRMGVYGDVFYCSLDDVVRQHADSGILFNATLIRCMIESGIYDIPLFDVSFEDVKSIDGGEFMEELESCYSRWGRDQTLVITRSNKRANHYNEGIRRYVLGADQELESGDMLMVVKNNYHFTEREQDFPIDFVANGDTAQLRRLRSIEELYGFRFAQAKLSFPDYDNVGLDCRILLDTISAQSPALTSEQTSKLFFAVAQDYADINSKSKRYAAVREDQYFNAMQIKFAYAVTCHKAQGGQWSAVFIDKMLFGDEVMSRDLLRWLYTAFTRATERVYLVNFDERFIDK